MNKIGQDQLLPENQVWKAIGIFVLLTALFSAPTYYMTIHLANMSYYYAFMMWMPGLAALVTCRIMGLSINSLGWGFGTNKWAIQSYLLPIFYISVAYCIAYFLGWVEPNSAKHLNYIQDKFGLAGWSRESFIIFVTFILLTVAFLRSMAHTLGEELGWRGFLVPQLMRKFGFLGTALVSGTIWALWHFPILLIGTYADMDLTVASPELWTYVLMLISMSFPLTYYRLKSGSLWPAVIFHASHNTVVYHIFGSMTRATQDNSKWLGEFGLILPLVTTVIAVYFYARARRENLDHKLGA